MTGSFRACLLATCLLVTSCIESPDDIKLVQVLAMSTCVDRAFARLGVKNADEDAVVVKIGYIEPVFRLVSTGQFVAKLPRFILKGTERAIDVSCTGDFNRRTITSLQIDGTIHRPTKAEDWTF